MAEGNVPYHETGPLPKPLSTKAITQELINAPRTQKFSGDLLADYVFQPGRLLLDINHIFSTTKDPWTIFETGEAFAQQIHDGVNQTEGYFRQKSKLLLCDGSETQLIFTAIQQIVAATKQEAATPFTKTGMREPTWIEANQRAKTVFDTRFPGVDINQIDHDPLYRLNWQQTKNKALLQEITAKKPNSIYEQQLDTLTQLRRNIRDTIFTKLIHLGIPLDITIGDNQEKIISYQERVIYPNLKESTDPFLGSALSVILQDNNGDIFQKIALSEDTRTEFIRIILLSMMYNNTNLLQSSLKSICDDDIDDRLSELKCFTDGNYDELAQSNKYVIDLRLPSPSDRHVSDNELAIYLLGQMFLGNIPVDFSMFDQLKRAINTRNESAAYETNSSLLLPSVTPDNPRKVFDTAEEEYANLQANTFLLRGDATQLVSLDTLVSPNNYSQPWQEITISHTPSTYPEVTIRSLAPSQGEYIDGIITGENTITGRIYALAIPPGYEITNLTVFSGDTTVPEFGILDIPTYHIYRSEKGEYMLASSSTRMPSQITYEVHVTQLHEQTPQENFELTPTQRSHLEAVSQRVGRFDFPFTTLSIMLHTLSQQDNRLTISDIESAIQNSFQYTLLGKDETIRPSQAEPDSLEFILSDVALGFVESDDQRKLIRVQCQHAAAITAAILREIFLPEEGFSINHRTVVKRKSLTINEAIMGTLHADLLVTKNDRHFVVDTTPPLSENVLHAELNQSASNQDESKPIDEINEMRKRINYILDGFDDLTQGHKVPQSERDFILQKTSPDIFQISKNLSPTQELFLVLHYLYHNPHPTKKAKEICNGIMTGIITKAFKLSQLDPRARETIESNLARFYGLGKNGLKTYNFISLAGIAQQIRALIPQDN